MKRKKLTVKKTPVYFVSVSSVAGLITTVAVLMIFSAILTKYDIPSDKIKYIWFLISGISGLATGLFAGKLSKSKSIIWGMISALSVSSVICLILVAFSGFAPELIFLPIIPVCVITGFFGAVISSNLKK